MTHSRFDWNRWQPFRIRERMPLFRFNPVCLFLGRSCGDGARKFMYSWNSSFSPPCAGRMAWMFLHLHSNSTCPHPTDSPSNVNSSAVRGLLPLRVPCAPCVSRCLGVLVVQLFKLPCTEGNMNSRWHLAAANVIALAAPTCMLNSVLAAFLDPNCTFGGSCVIYFNISSSVAGSRLSLEPA